MNLAGKTFVVTGASGGIGHATVRILDRENAHLVLVGRDNEKLTRINQELDCKHLIVQSDLATDIGRDKLIAVCSSQRIDGLINNAGTNSFKEFQSTSDKEVIEIINTNLISPILLTKSFLPILSKNKQSIILNVGSSFGSLGYPCFTSYSASKFGLKGFTEALKRELLKTTTKVLYISPRATDTKLNPGNVIQLNKLLGNKVDSADSVAESLVAQLKSETARVALGWPEKIFLKVNGLFPSLVDRVLAKQLTDIKKCSRLSKVTF